VQTACFSLVVLCAFVFFLWNYFLHQTFTEMRILSPIVQIIFSAALIAALILIDDNNVIRMVLLSASCGLTAYVYSHILTAQGNILSWVAKLLQPLESRCNYLWKPLIGCHECVAGQMALWSYLGFALSGVLPYYWYAHIVLICAAIIFSNIFKKIDIWSSN
jgi:hypothetical protein